MYKSIFAPALFAALAIGASSAANASVSVSSVPGPDGAGQTVLFDFNSATPGLSGNYGLRTGSVSGQYAAPLGDMTQYLVVPTQGTTGQALLDLGGAYTNLSFYWGSIDSYNTVSFYSGANGTGTLLGSVGGGTVPGATADGSQGTNLNNRRVFFTFGGDQARSVVFASSQIAFEVDDVATTSVPEPAMWATMIAGFALVGGSMRRRKMTTVAA